MESKNKQRYPLEFLSTRVQPNGEDVKMRVLDLCAMSGFFEIGRDHMPMACLSVCNTFRDSVPLPRLRVHCQMPNSLLDVVFPNFLQTIAASTIRSRVIPYKQVLTLERSWVTPEDPRPPGRRNIPKFIAALIPEEQSILGSITWPEGLKEIVFDEFNEPIQGRSWPATVERLTLSSMPVLEIDSLRGGFFNESLVGVDWPARLQELHLGPEFDEPIDAVEWPASLRKLSMPCFNQPIQGVRWPAGLEDLEFLHPDTIAGRRKGQCGKLGLYYGFNQSIAGVGGLPAGLLTLWLSDNYDHGVDEVVWPSKLREVGFGCSSESFAGAVWPSTLERLIVVKTELSDDDFGDVPVGCEIVVAIPEDNASDWIGDFDAQELLEMESGIGNASSDEDEGDYDEDGGASDFSL